MPGCHAYTIALRAGYPTAEGRDGSLPFPEKEPNGEGEGNMGRGG